MKTNLLKTERTPAPIVFSFEILSSQRGSAPPTRKLPELFEADQPVTVQVHLFQQRVHLLFRKLLADGRQLLAEFVNAHAPILVLLKDREGNLELLLETFFEMNLLPLPPRLSKFGKIDLAVLVQINLPQHHLHLRVAGVTPKYHQHLVEVLLRDGPTPIHIEHGEDLSHPLYLLGRHLGQHKHRVGTSAYEADPHVPPLRSRRPRWLHRIEHVVVPSP
mmetsp:Transcript_2363/g.4975  ORF Transcript_2363/g.4975 Transcript_2363/m.4975 type:complete len:219 (-) Transcript_2363:281-937(-)